MKIYENGIYRELTLEEIENLKLEKETFQFEPTLEERLEALEELILKSLLENK